MPRPGPLALPFFSTFKPLVLSVILSTSLIAANQVPLAPPRLSNTQGFKRDVAAAASTSQALAVWIDGRSGLRDELIATRLSVDGAVKDSNGIVIDRTVSYSGQVPIGVASDGRDFLVVFSCRTKFVCSKRVLEDGSIGETSTLGEGESPKVTWAGGNYLVVFARSLFNGRPYFEIIRVDSEGRPIGHSEQITGVNPNLASNASTAMLVFRNGQRILALPITAGLSRGPERLIADESFGPLTIAANDRHFAVSWPVTPGLRTVILDQNGTPSKPIDFVSNKRIDRISSSWIDGRFVIAVGEYLSNSNASAIKLLEIRLNTDTATVSEGFSPIGSQPTLLRSSAAALLLWRHEQPEDGFGDQVISAARLSENLDAVAMFPVSTGVTEGTQSVACRDSGNAIAAWMVREGALNKRKVEYGVLSGSPPRVASAVMRLPEGSADQEAPQLSCNGNQAALLWTESERGLANASIKIALLNGAGAIIDVTTVAIDADPRSAAAIEWDGSEYLVAFARSDRRLMTVKFNPASKSISLPLVVSEIPAFRGEAGPRLSWSGKTFLLVWKYFIPSQCQITCPDAQPALESRVLQRSGAPLGASTRLTPSLSGEYSLDWNGRDFLVVFGGYIYFPNFQHGTFLRRFSELGTPTGEVKVSEYDGGAALFTRGTETTTIHYQYIAPTLSRTVTVFDANLNRRRQWTIGERTPGYYPRLLREIRSTTGAKEFLFSDYDPIYNAPRSFVSAIAEEAERRRSQRIR